MYRSDVLITLSPLPHFVQAHSLSCSALAGDPCPSCRSSSPSEAAPSLLECRPEVRNSLTCSVSFNSALSWLIRPCRRSTAPARRPRAVPSQTGPVLSPSVGPQHSPPLAGASPSLSAPDFPSCGRDSSPELPQLAWRFSSAALLLLASVSWPEPHQ
jgi:hypothetical protein